MKIPKATIRKIMKKDGDIKISDSAAEAIAEMLEKRAKSIANYAVKRAKKQGRKTVSQEDVDTYRMKFGV